jgi:AcrR family transcriptional regulator
MTQGRSRTTAKADRAASIKQSAIEVFAEHGYHKAKVSMIVRRVGVAQGTFYLYYKSKREIFDEILDDFLTMVTGSVDEWNIGDVDTVDNFRASLIDLGDILLQVLVKNQMLTQIFFNEGLAVHPEFAERIRSFYEELVDVMTGINRLNAQRGLLREADYRVLALCTLGMVERCIQVFIVTPEEPPSVEELRHIVREIVDFFIDGAAPRPAPSL